MSPACYTYAVARAFGPERVAGLCGVDGAAVHLVGYRDLVAVVSALWPADAEESALRARLESLEQLEAIARAHHAVVEAVAARAVTLPLRLATIHRGDGRVAEVLRREYRGFCAALDRLAGRVELGVKVYVNRSSTPAGPGESALHPGAASPGKEYLRRRRQENQQREDTWRFAASAADRLDRAMTELAINRRHHRPQDGRLSGRPGENILNVAYLVESARIDEFVRLGQHLDVETLGVAVEITGPWAPYSFALPQDAIGSSGEHHEVRT